MSLNIILRHAFRAGLVRFIIVRHGKLKAIEMGSTRRIRAPIRAAERGRGWRYDRRGSGWERVKGGGGKGNIGEEYERWSPDNRTANRIN